MVDAPNVTTAGIGYEPSSSSGIATSAEVGVTMRTVPAPGSPKPQATKATNASLARHGSGSRGG